MCYLYEEKNIHPGAFICFYHHFSVFFTIKNFKAPSGLAHRSRKHRRVVSESFTLPAGATKMHAAEAPCWAPRLPHSNSLKNRWQSNPNKTLAHEWNPAKRRLSGPGWLLGGLWMFMALYRFSFQDSYNPWISQKTQWPASNTAHFLVGEKRSLKTCAASRFPWDIGVCPKDGLTFCLSNGHWNRPSNRNCSGTTWYTAQKFDCTILWNLQTAIYTSGHSTSLAYWMA